MHILLTKKVSFIGICIFFWFCASKFGDSFSFFSLWQCPRLKEKCQYLPFVVNMSRDAICVMSGATPDTKVFLLSILGLSMDESGLSDRERCKDEDHTKTLWSYMEFFEVSMV